jgi:hypothetical protein
LKKEFRSADIALTCWQYRPVSHSPYWQGHSFGLTVNCEAASPVHGEYFYAQFGGREEDLPAFYHIIAGVQPVE